MPKPHLYQFDKSPFYRLRSRTKLANLLKISTKELLQLSKKPTYNKFNIEPVGKKARHIEEPIGLLKSVHVSIHKLLRRIETPPYLFSGRKNTTYIDNAKSHLGHKYFLSLDIASFYPCCKTEYVFRFFHYRMQIIADLAWIMANIVTCDGHIPTGSSLSQSIAYWSYSKLFDELNELAKLNNMSLSLYVDDIQLSSFQKIPENILDKIEARLHSVDLSIKKSKVRLGSNKHYKVITGCAITPDDRLDVPNRLRKKIFDVIKKERNINYLPDKTVVSLTGRIEAARRVVANFHDSIYQKLKERKKTINRTKRTIAVTKSYARNK
jgi:hypothetical protein